MKVHKGFPLVLIVLAGTSVAHSLIWDWKIQQKTASEIGVTPYSYITSKENY